MNNSPIDMIEIVAEGLGELIEKVVFVGGAVASLYCDDAAARRVRPTTDVDFIIEIYSNKEYAELEEEPRHHGFKHDISPGAPICRKIYNDVKVDVMPTESSVLGFTNRWYSEGITRSEKTTLPSTREISILPLPYYLGSKIEAFKQRGNNDYLFSHDIEDIITVLDGRVNLYTLIDADTSIKDYLKAELGFMADDIHFIESVSGHIGYGTTRTARASRIIDFIKEFNGIS